MHLRRYLIAIATTLAIAIALAWAQPGNPTLDSITWDNVLTFPGAPTLDSVEQGIPDAAAPLVAMTLTDTFGADPYYENGTVEWSATCDDAGGSGCTSCQLRHSGTTLVGSADSTPGDGFSGSWVTGLTSGNDTQYVFDIVCDDGFANRGESTDQTVTVDVTAPVAAIDAYPDPTLSGNISTFAIVTDVSSGVASVQFRLDDGGGATNVGSADTVAPYSLVDYDSTQQSDGTYDVNCIALDNVGNSSTCTSEQIVIDNTAPTQPTNLVATVDATVPESEIDLAWTASTDIGGTNIQHYEIYWCDNSTPTCTPTLQDISPTNSYSAVQLNADTEYIFSVRAIDNADNPSAMSATDTESTQAVGVDLTAGLIGWWEFEGNATDSSPTGLDGTPYGSPGYTTSDGGMVGEALVLDAVNEGIGFGTESQLGTLGIENEITVCLWVNPADNTFAKKPVSWFDVTNNSLSFDLWTDQNIYMRAYYGNTESLLLIGSYIASTWYHLCNVWDNGVHLAYLNGSLDTSEDRGAVTLDKDAVNLRIGEHGNFSNDFFGMIDELRIYNEAKDAAFIAAIHAYDGSGGGTPADGDRFVDDTAGVDTGDCTDSQNPCATIPFAYALAQPGETITVADGTYSGGTSGQGIALNRSGSSGSPITLRAANRHGAIIDQNNSTIFVHGIRISGDWNIVDGFIIQDAHEHSVVVYGDNNQIINTIQRFNGNNGDEDSSFGAGGIYEDDAASNNLYLRNYIHDNGRPACAGNATRCNLDHCIYIKGNAAQIIGNVCDTNEAYGIHIYDGVTQSITIDNNTIYGHGRSGILFHSLTLSGTSNIRNNIIYNNSNDLNSAGVLLHSTCGGSGTVALNSNIIFDNSVSGSFVDDGACNSSNTGMIEENPGLADPTNGDFTLQSVSPAREAGLTISAANPDIAGTSRPQETNYDIGAYEFVP